MTTREYLVEFAKELEGWCGLEFTQGHNIEAFDKIVDKFMSENNIDENTFNEMCEEYEEEARNSV